MNQGKMTIIHASHKAKIPIHASQKKVLEIAKTIQANINIQFSSPKVFSFL